MAPTSQYPHKDGDITVLGPEIFASLDGNVICWKGDDYVRQVAPASTPPALAVDYSGHPLTEGAPVAFLTVDPIGLAHGHVRIIGPNDLCIDTGQHLVVFQAARGLRLPLPSPLGGAVKSRPIPDGAQQYHQVALQPTQDGA